MHGDGTPAATTWRSKQACPTGLSDVGFSCRAVVKALTYLFSQAPLKLGVDVRWHFTTAEIPFRDLRQRIYATCRAWTSAGYVVAAEYKTPQEKVLF
jgi:hypothetical protein